MAEELTKEQQELADSAEQDDGIILSLDNWIDCAIKETEWLDLTQEFHEPRFTLQVGESKFAPIGGLHGLTGQPGHGKTMTFTQFIVAILRGECGNIRYILGEERPAPRVLYIDTEMEQENTLAVNARICKMMGWTFKSEHYDRFRILWLREEENRANRWRKVLKAIWEYKPDFVFLDGLIDVIEDFNSNAECQEMIYKLMKVASFYKISLWALLHQNPGTTKMVGHAGSFLERKATDIFTTTKTKDEKMHDIYFTISQHKARGRDVDDIIFRVQNTFALGEPIQEGCKTLDDKRDDEEREYRKILGEIYKEKPSFSYYGLREALKKKLGIGSPKAKKFVERAVEIEVLQNVADKLLITQPKQKDIFEAPAEPCPF